MPPVRPPRHEASAIVVLALLTAFAPISMDLYLPAVPSIAPSFGVAAQWSAATFSACVFGIAAGQPAWGPIADRWGRRRPLLIGVTGFVVGSALCAVSPSVELLVASRFVQGFCAASGIVIGRAVIRDMYTGRRLATVMSRLTIATGAAPTLAPLAGVIVLVFSDWRGTFWVLVAFGTALLVAVWMLVPETLDPQNRLASVSHVVVRSRMVIRQRGFLVYAFVLASGMTPLFAYLTFSPQVLQIERGLDEAAFALLFALNSAGLVAAGQVNAVLVRRVRVPRMLRVGLGVSLVGSVGTLACSLLHAPTWVLAASFFVVASAVGLILPNTTTLALGPISVGTGIASSILGFVQFSTVGILPAAASVITGANSFTMGWLMTLCAVAALGILATNAAREHRRTTRGTPGVGDVRPTRPPR